MSLLGLDIVAAGLGAVVSALYNKVKYELSTGELKLSKNDYEFYLKTKEKGAKAIDELSDEDWLRYKNAEHVEGILEKRHEGLSTFLELEKEKNQGKELSEEEKQTRKEVLDFLLEYSKCSTHPTSISEYKEVMGSVPDIKKIQRSLKSLDAYIENCAALEVKEREEEKLVAREAVEITETGGEVVELGAPQRLSLIHI